MLQRNRHVRTQILQIKDAALFAVGLWLAHYLRSLWWIDLFPGSSHPLGDFNQFAYLYVALIPMVPLVMESVGFYQRPMLMPRWQTAWMLFKGCALITVGIILFMFLFRLTELNRSVIGLFPVTSFLLVFGSEELIQRWLRSKYGQEQFRKRLVLVGSPEDTRRTRDELRHKAAGEVEVVGELDLNDNTIQQLVDLLHERSPNGVILTARHTYFGQVEKAIQACEIEGVEVWLLADFFQTQISRTTFDEFYGRPVLIFRSVPEASWQAVAKQLIDLVGSALLILAAAPVWVIVPLLIKVTSPGPVLFRQRRCGLNGRPFTMLKFRSMVTDAEQRKQELEALNEMSGPVFKVTNDPRVTWIGRWLRKTSIDELPQLFNVLRGEMSLVGPRPLPVDEVQRFDDPAHRRRLSVKPGLTCLWQVSGRNEVRDFKEWVRLDLEYIDNWSLWLDLKILWRTVPAVLAGAGAK
ncbi:MAG TPA: sugar transferase [Methylomirabilota bacterium]|nr:sugar transferase [Methylomirabilota bacterium]